MPRVNRQRQRKQRRHQWNLSFNLYVPTVSLVLICFSIATFYVAKGQWLWLIVGWLLLASAAIYFNTYWYGDVKQLKHQLKHYKSNEQVLIIDASSSEPIKKHLKRLGSLSNVTITNKNFNHLKFENGKFDLVLVHYVFQDIKPRLTRIKAMQEAARVVKPNGDICTFTKGFNAEQYSKFLRQSGFIDIKIKNNGLLGWWSGPWKPSFTITGKKG